MKQIEKSLKHINDMIAEREEKSFVRTKEVIFRIENDMRHSNESLINDIMELDEQIENLKKFYNKVSKLSDRYGLVLDECNLYVIRPKI